jgi:hypothetical protein
MPKVGDYDNEKDWMSACVPKMMSDKGMENDQAVAACMNMWRERDKASKKDMEVSFADRFHKLFRFLGLDLEAKEGEEWVTINGQHVLIDQKSGEVKGGNKKAVGWKDPHEEFKFVQRRLAAGNLKRGEKRMLERRSERLAKQVLGVKD